MRPGGPLAEQARRIRLVCDAYRWPDAAGIVLDELEARFRRAVQWNRERGTPEGVCIFEGMIAWLGTNRAALAAGPAGDYESISR